MHPPRYTSLESRGRAPYRRFGPRHRPYRGRGHTQVNMHPNSWPMEHGEPIQGELLHDLELAAFEFANPIQVNRHHLTFLHHHYLLEI